MQGHILWIGGDGSLENVVQFSRSGETSSGLRVEYESGDVEEYTDQEWPTIIELSGDCFEVEYMDEGGDLHLLSNLKRIEQIDRGSKHRIVWKDGTTETRKDILELVSGSEG